MTTLKFGAFDFYVGGRGEARMFSLFQLNQLSALVRSSWLPVIVISLCSLETQKWSWISSRFVGSYHFESDEARVGPPKVCSSSIQIHSRLPSDFWIVLRCSCYELWSSGRVIMPGSMELLTHGANLFRHALVKLPSFTRAMGLLALDRLISNYGTYHNWKCE